MCSRMGDDGVATFVARHMFMAVPWLGSRVRRDQARTVAIAPSVNGGQSRMAKPVMERGWERFRDGERAALERVYREHVALVRSSVRAGLYRTGRLSSSNLADIVQETFVKAFSRTGRQGYDGTRAYAPYILAIARNCLIDWLRRARREVPTHHAKDPPIETLLACGTGNSENFAPDLLEATTRFVRSLPLAAAEAPRKQREHQERRPAGARPLGVGEHAARLRVAIRGTAVSVAVGGRLRQGLGAGGFEGLKRELLERRELRVDAPRELAAAVADREGEDAQHRARFGGKRGTAEVSETGARADGEGARRNADVDYLHLLQTEPRREGVLVTEPIADRRDRVACLNGTLQSHGQDRNGLDAPVEDDESKVVLAHNRGARSEDGLPERGRLGAAFGADADSNFLGRKQRAELARSAAVIFELTVRRAREPQDACLNRETAHRREQQIRRNERARARITDAVGGVPPHNGDDSVVLSAGSLSSQDRGALLREIPPGQERRPSAGSRRIRDEVGGVIELLGAFEIFGGGKLTLQPGEVPVIGNGIERTGVVHTDDALLEVTPADVALQNGVREFAPLSQLVG